MKQSMIFLSVLILCQFEVMKAEDVPEGCEDEHKIEIITCCKHPDDMSFAKVVKEGSFDKCMEEIIGNKKMSLADLSKESVEKKECLEECMFKANDWLTPDMKLKPEDLAASINKALGGHKVFKDAIDKTIKTCVKNEVAAEAKNDAKCKSGAFQVVECFVKQLFMNCPDEAWDSKREICSKAKEVFTKCPNY